MKIRKIHIDNYKIFRNFDINLTSENNAQNLIVIAGINGSGKTTLFEYIKKFVVHGKLNYSDSIELDINDEIKVYTQEVIDDIAIKIEPEFYTGILPQIKELSTKVLYFRANEQNTDNTNNVIVEFIDKLIYEKKLNPESAYNKVTEIINTMFSGFNFQVKFYGLDRKKNVLFINESGEKLALHDLSSGERELLTKIFSLYLEDVNDCLILIDEPENSLHPIWQNMLAPVLQEFANKNNNQIVLATHSPHIVASVKKEQIRVLVKENNRIRAIDSFDGSYGWKVDRVLLEIFRTDTLRTPQVQNKLDELIDILSNNEHNTDLFKTKLSSLENEIGFADTDLALIRIEVLRKNRNK